MNSIVVPIRNADFSNYVISVKDGLAETRVVDNGFFTDQQAMNKLAAFLDESTGFLDKRIKEIFG